MRQAILGQSMEGFADEYDDSSPNELQNSKELLTIPCNGISFISEIEEKFNIKRVMMDSLVMQRQSQSSLDLLIQTRGSFKLYIPQNTILDTIISSEKLLYLGPVHQSSVEIYSLFQNNNDQTKYKILSQSIPKLKLDPSRPFIGMNPNAKTRLKFDSNFESGNLDIVHQVGEVEYNLYMRVDTNSKGHSNWFNFRVSGTKSALTVKFNILNFTRPRTLYQKGLLPFVQSAIAYRTRNECFYKQDGQKVSYTPQLNCKKKQFKLSFYYTFEFDNDVVSFALLPPYTYTFLLKMIKKWRKKLKFQQKGHNYLVQTVLCKTIAGIEVPLLTVTDLKDGLPLDQRRTVIITSRIHPSESNASWMVHGFVQFILGDSYPAQQLRKVLVFKIIPMLNPDGVVVGNYRNSLAGEDLNRKFLSDDLFLFPEVNSLKDLIQQSENLLFYLDLHGHSQKKFLFSYGPNEGRYFPTLLQSVCTHFRLRSCRYGVTNDKLSTARAFAGPYAQGGSYTLETSYMGTSDSLFNEESWKEQGVRLGEAIYAYLQRDEITMKQSLSPLKKSKQWQLPKPSVKQYIPQQTTVLPTRRELSISSDEVSDDSNSDCSLDEDLPQNELFQLQNEIKNSLSQLQRGPMSPILQSPSPEQDQNESTKDYPIEPPIAIVQTVRAPPDKQILMTRKQYNYINELMEKRRQIQTNRQTLKPHIVCDQYNPRTPAKVRYQSRTVEMRNANKKTEFRSTNNKTFFNRTPLFQRAPHLPKINDVVEQYQTFYINNRRARGLSYQI